MKESFFEKIKGNISETNIIHTTYDYNIFKRLKGNRSVSRTRVDKIKNSILKVGYITSPIVVNEKLEIIDGQGRAQALEELHMPIDYIIVPQIGIEECRAMNIDQSNWSIKDYIDSYAEDDIQSYVYFKDLIDKYKKNGIGMITINNAITGFGSMDTNAIKNGKFECSKSDYKKAEKILEFEREFVPIIKKIDGRTDYWYIAIGYCYTHEDIDNNELIRKMNDGYLNAGSPANINQALDEIQKIYCFKRRKGKKLYLSNDYQRMMDEKFKRHSK